MGAGAWRLAVGVAEVVGFASAEIGEPRLSVGVQAIGFPDSAERRLFALPRGDGGADIEVAGDDGSALAGGDGVQAGFAGKGSVWQVIQHSEHVHEGGAGFFGAVRLHQLGQGCHEFRAVCGHWTILRTGAAGVSKMPMPAFRLARAMAARRT